MKQFYQKVNMNDRDEMIAFLAGHFRYDTMNGWNHSTSYANNVKIYNLGIDPALTDKLYDFINTDEYGWLLDDFIASFAEDHHYYWQVGFNGRSGGYVVLYQGYQKKSEYKSYCTSCGQKNFQSVKENGNRCGCCGKDTRKDYAFPLMEHGVYPGRDTDMNEDFEDWTDAQLCERVKLVQEFDQWCDDLLAELVYMLERGEIVEEVVMVPQKKLVYKG